jgi:hypothetical protein
VPRTFVSGGLLLVHGDEVAYKCVAIKGILLEAKTDGRVSSMGSRYQSLEPSRRAPLKGGPVFEQGRSLHEETAAPKTFCCRSSLVLGQQLSSGRWSFGFGVGICPMGQSRSQHRFSWR